MHRTSESLASQLTAGAICSRVVDSNCAGSEFARQYADDIARITSYVAVVCAVASAGSCLVIMTPISWGASGVYATAECDGLIADGSDACRDAKFDFAVSALSAGTGREAPRAAAIVAGAYQLLRDLAGGSGTGGGTGDGSSPGTPVCRVYSPSPEMGAAVCYG